MYTGPRHQMNQRTSYLDLSQVYGNNIKAMRELRTLHGGESIYCLEVTIQQILSSGILYNCQ